MTHPEFQTAQETQELIDPQANIDDMPEEFGGMPERTELEVTINKNVQIIMAVRDRLAYLEDIAEGLSKAGQRCLFTNNAIADCKAVLDDLNAPHYTDCNFPVEIGKESAL